MTSSSTTSLIRKPLKKPEFVWYGRDMEVQLFLGNPPEEHTILNQYIYLTNRHLSTQTTNIIYYFFLFRAKNKHPIAVFQLIPSDLITWISPAKAPFGGIQSIEKSLCDEIIFLLKCVENIIEIKGGKRIIIKTSPEKYDANGHKKLYTCYKRLGYEPKEIFKNHLITVTDLPFSHIIRSAEKRRLNKCRKADFTVILTEKPDIIEVYDFINSVRDRLGYSLSLSFYEFENLAETFPNELKVFEIYDQDKLIALTVTILVNHEILYNFLPADVVEYRRYSPMVMLMDGVYQYCQQMKISTIDLGISLDHLGNEKASLIRFKENLGGRECSKITWQKNLDTQTVIRTIEDRGTGFMSNDR